MRHIKNKRVIFIALLCSILSASFTSTVYSQNNVVVVPLGGSDVTEEDLVPLRVWRGRVSPDGTKSGTGRFTPIKTGTGTYIIRLDLDIPGLDTSTSNFPGFGVPIVSLRGFPGDSINIIGQSKGNSNGQTVVLDFDVQTRDSTNDLVDRSFTFHFMLEEPNGISAKTTPASSLYPDMRCTKEGEIETCVIGVQREP